MTTIYIKDEGCLGVVLAWFRSGVKAIWFIDGVRYSSFLTDDEYVVFERDFKEGEE